MMKNYHMLMWGVATCAVAGALSLGVATAENPPKSDVGLRSPSGAGQVGIPGCLAKLSLSAEQQGRIRGIVEEYEADLTSVWKQFGDRYMQTIQTEALLLAAIEDNLSESQRQQVRDQRRRTAQHQKAMAGTDAKPNQSTARPASAVEEEIAIVGIKLTADQEAAADKLQEKYLGHLRSLNRDIQGLHTRLVSLEADKLVEIESVLTKDQLTQLHEIRQNAPDAPKVTSSQTTPVKIQ